MSIGDNNALTVLAENKMIFNVPIGKLNKKQTLLKQKIMETSKNIDN